MELSSLTLKFFVTMNIRIISLIDAAFDDPFLDLISASKMSAKEPGRKKRYDFFYSISKVVPNLKFFRTTSNTLWELTTNRRSHSSSELILDVLVFIRIHVRNHKT